MMEFSKEIKQESKRIQERTTEVAGLLRELEGYEGILIALGKGDAMGATFISEKNSNTPLILYKIFERMTDVDKLAFMAMVLGLEEE